MWPCDNRGGAHTHTLAQVIAHMHPLPVNVMILAPFDEEHYPGYVLCMLECLASRGRLRLLN